MGTWGEGPFDNDGACDMIIELMNPIRVVADPKNKVRAQRLYGEARAACQIVLLAHGTDALGGPYLGMVLRVLVRIRSDVESLSGWRSPRTIASRLDTEIAAVLDKMKTCKGCRASRTKRDFVELEALAKAAYAVEIPASRMPEKRKRRHRRKRRVVVKVKKKRGVPWYRDA